MRAHPPPADCLHGTAAASRLPDGPQGDRDHERRTRIARHLQMPQDPESRGQDLRVFLPPRRREERAGRHLQAARLAQGADREPAALRGRPQRQGRRHPRRGRVAEGQDLHPRDRLPPRPRADAGLHRRAGRGRPRRHARRHEGAGRRPLQDQPAGAGRPRHRPLRAGRLLRLGRRLREERGARVRAQQGALRVPALGRRRLQQLPRRAAGHRHLPPGQPREPRAVGVDQARPLRAGFPRHLRRHRQPHHHGQRAGRARLGRGRHRGGGGHARPAGRHGDPRGDRLRLQGQAQGRRHRHRPGAHLHADAAQARRGGEVRRVLRRGARPPLGGGPRNDRQHGARVRRHLRLLPGRRRHHQVSQGHRPRA